MKTIARLLFLVIFVTSCGVAKVNKNITVKEKKHNYIVTDNNDTIVVRTKRVLNVFKVNKSYKVKLDTIRINNIIKYQIMYDTKISVTNN